MITDVFLIEVRFCRRSWNSSGPLVAVFGGHGEVDMTRGSDEVGGVESDTRLPHRE